MSFHRVILLLTFILLGTCHSENNCSFSDVASIVKNFTDSDVRPVKDWKNPTNVSIDLTLYTIISLDTSLQTLTTFLWFSMEWNNEFLSWNPKDFCDIKKIFISTNDFWLPDLYIYEMTFYDKDNPVIPYLKVSNNGEIKYSYPLKVTSTCDLNIYKFPFDIQTCNLTFGPYIHSVKDIIMRNKYNSTEVYKSSINASESQGEWSLLDITVGADNKSVGSNNYSIVTYSITMQRAPVLYIINLIIPACFMVILDIASMFIPMQTGERLGFKITVVLGFSVLLLILNNLLPSSNNTPILGIFFSVCLSVMVASIIGSIGTSYLLMLSKNQPDVPFWVKTCIIKYLGRILFFKVKAPQQDNLVFVEVAEKDGRDCKKAKTHTKIMMRKTDIDENIQISKEVKLLEKLLVEVLKIHKEIMYTKEQDNTNSDWQFAAMVIDRFILVVYVTTVIIMLVAVIIIWAT
ncbi:5-hydroxytryptamine receptor 3A-like [Leptodactylus fuscus]|uniref:5-hydroxytryptamine receptor 3A-like n=1 Tax=Leptodactylus fuscus TaxID=238119 RepID=UPI003F4F06D1